MIDQEIRALERASAAAPSDEGLRSQLEHAWLRLGRGWRGDRLIHNARGNMAAEGERGIWRWLVAPLAATEIPMVYVEGGDVECRACSGTGWETWHGYDGPERDGCGVCHFNGPKPGVLTIKPFYVGRFPVTWREYLAFCRDASIREYRLPPWASMGPDGLPVHRLEVNNVVAIRSLLNDPVVCVSFDEAQAFCSWAGVRLLSRAEWDWVAFGPPVALPPNEHRYENDRAYDESSGVSDHLGKLYCLYCGDSGVGVHERPCLRRKRRPWGDEKTTDNHCVTGSHSVYGKRSTAPVVETARELIARNVKFQLRRHDTLDALDDLYPARPDGKSWCGAHDMAGNVWEWRSDHSALGGGWRIESGGPQLDWDMALSQRYFENNRFPWRHDFSRDDIGFRVAISTEGATT